MITLKKQLKKLGITYEAYADREGITRAAVYKLIEAGCVVDDTGRVLRPTNYSAKSGALEGETTFNISVAYSRGIFSIPNQFLAENDRDELIGEYAAMWIKDRASVMVTEVPEED